MGNILILVDEPLEGLGFFTFAFLKLKVREVTVSAETLSVKSLILVLASSRHSSFTRVSAFVVVHFLGDLDEAKHA